MKKIIPIIAGILLFSAGQAFCAWNVWVDHSIKKYRQGGQDGRSGNQTVNIAMARNEFESFQILVYADNENLSNIDISVSDFATENGDTISNIYLYKQHYINCTRPSRQEYETGMWPDALIPKVDRYYHEERNTFPVDCSSGNVQGFWVDVGTSTNTAPGNYTSTITVSADGKSNRTLTVNLMVFDFTLPSTPTYKSQFGMQTGYIQFGHHGGYDNSTFREMVPLYAKAAVYHRMGLWAYGENYIDYTWDGGSKTLTMDDADFSIWDGIFADVLAGTAISSGPYAGARMNSVQVPQMANTPEPDEDGSIATADKQTATRQYLQEWFDHFGARWGDPMDRLFVPVHDEPHGTMVSWRGSTVTDYEKVVDVANDVNNVDTSTYGDGSTWRNVFVNKHNVAELNGFDNKGIYDPWIGHYTCEGWRFHDGSCGNTTYRYPRNEYPEYPNETGVDHWSYLSNMSIGAGGTGDSQYSDQIDLSVDAPAMYNRLISYVFWHYEVRGLLYWSINEGMYYGDTTPNMYEEVWSTQFGANGDGHLFYPGIASKDSGESFDPSTPAIGGRHDIPIASIRAKYIRDVMEDFEYMELAKQSTSKSNVDSYVNTMFTNTAFPPGAYWSLNMNAQDLRTARRNIASLITGNTSSVEEPPLPVPPGLSVTGK